MNGPFANLMFDDELYFDTEKDLSSVNFASLQPTFKLNIEKLKRRHAKVLKEKGTDFTFIGPMRMIQYRIKKM